MHVVDSVLKSMACESRAPRDAMAYVGCVGADAIFDVHIYEDPASGFSTLSGCGARLHGHSI